MACNGCGSDTGLTKEQVENLILKLIKDGVVQGTLRDCEGEDLTTGSAVLLCSALAAKIKDFIEDGTIDVITDVKLADGKLVVTDGAGNVVNTPLPAVKDIKVKDGKLVVTSATGEKEEYSLDKGVSGLAFNPLTNKLSWEEGGKTKEATLPYTKAVAGANEVVFTLPDGSSVGVPKAAGALSPDNMDHTIQKGANVQDKYGLKLRTGGGLTAGNVNGVEVSTVRLLDASGTVVLGHLVNK